MNDEIWMAHALELARQSQGKNEVPVGAVVVLENKIIGVGHNQPIATHDPTAHAEIVAMRAAAQKINNYRLVNTTLYVTLEPCQMCLGAIFHARVKRLVFATSDQKRNNHYGALELTSGILADQSSKLLKDFFIARR